MACALALAVPAIHAGRAQQPSDSRITTLLEQADNLGLGLKVDEALAKIDEALALAEKLGDRVGLAMSYHARGTALFRASRSSDSHVWLDRGLAAFEALDNKAGVAKSLAGLTRVAVVAGNTTKAREHGNRALRLLVDLGDDRGRANILASLLFLNLSPAALAEWQREFDEVMTRVTDPLMLGVAQRIKGASHFNAGDLAAARAAFERAISQYERTPDIAALATSYLQLGRVFRAHGDYEGAIQRYQKAIDLLEPTKERYVVVEATNALAIALGYLNRHREAIAAYERGLTLAREGSNKQMIDFMEGNLAGGLLSAGEPARAIPALQAVIARKPDRSNLGFRYLQLAGALAKIGRSAEAVVPVNEAIQIAREFKQNEMLGIRLDNRASIFTTLGRFEEALADARESVAIVEDIRTKIVPSDFMKRGYAERVDSSYIRIVNLLAHLGRAGEAIEFAEQGRTRAFLDLLATRPSSLPVLETRGAPGTQPVPTEPASRGIGTPASLSDIGRTVERLGSTIVSFWVMDDSTLAFVLRKDAAPTSVRLPVKREALTELIAATTAALREPAKATASTRGAEVDPDVTALPMRGLGLLALGRDAKTAWRELHRTLIEPLRPHLPARGGRLTIVPHGPLFQLSFAALQNAAGRYLIEDYDLGYAPSISVLDFTSRRQQAVASNLSSAWAIVGNPASLPIVGTRPLAPLPGAAREIASIGALAPGGGTPLRLDGVRADESTVTITLSTAHPSVLHFATHGFVFDDPKQPPFLALNRRGSTPAEDGRLTLNEVYDLRLMTDLVVLSACRTGAGTVSTDGVIGLTRGFFYAGAPTVIATFWDVTDETTSVLMTSFYRGYATARSKGPSLRAAQLKLLADLRAGKVTVTAAGRRVTLPEHPLLWAAFFLSGEP